MHQLLLTVDSELTTAIPASKRVFLFTSECIPPCPPNQSQEAMISQATEHAKRLSESDVEIELFAIYKPGEVFDYSKFYTSIISFDPDEVNENDTRDPYSKISDLSLRIRRKEFKKRRLGRVDFRISEGVIIGTQLYARSSNS